MTKPTLMSARAPAPGDLKQRLARAYNAVNQELFGAGVQRLRVDLLDDRIVIVAEHQRVRALVTLAAGDPYLARLVDAELCAQGKARLQAEVEALTGQRVRAVLRDYDPASQMAATVIVLKEPLHTIG